MKNKNVYTTILAIIFISYFLIDIIHFFQYRINPTYSPIAEAFYENRLLSFIKWLLCLVSLIGLFLNKKGIKTSFYTLFVASLGILILFLLKGQLNYLLVGSFVFEFGVLEIGAILVLTYLLIKLIKKYKIKIWSIGFTFLLTALIFTLLLNLIPAY